MPPRPRPRPKAATTTAASTSTADFEDDDDIFIRNKSRSLQTWAKLDEMNRKTDHQAPADVSDDDDLEESPRRKRSKRKDDDRTVPSWQRDQSLKRLLSTDVDLDSDSDLEIIDMPPSKSQERKRKRKEGAPRRSRSKSLTPPPDVSLSEIQAARSIVRQTLQSTSRPLDEDDSLDLSTDTIYLDPELERIARSVQLNFRHSASNDKVVLDPEDTVDITVKWIPHPRSPLAKERTFIFKVRRQDNLRDLFDATAEEASVLEANIVIQYKMHRLFSSVTPHTLKIFSTAEFLACDKNTYQYIKDNGGFDHYIGGHRTPSPDPAPQQPLDGDVSDIGAESDDEATFSIVLRSSATQGKDITLTVRPSTKCGKIVAAFLKRAGLSDRYDTLMKNGSQGRNTRCPHLSIDGERMGDDVEIGEQDLEDGDIVEVVGV